MKKYVKPFVEVKDFEINDVIATSNEIDLLGANDLTNLGGIMKATVVGSVNDALSFLQGNS